MADREGSGSADRELGSRLLRGISLEFLCYTRVRKSSENMICGCIPGGGCQVGVGI